MSFSHGSKAKVLLNGNDLSDYIKGVGSNNSLDVADVSVLGNTAKQYVTGLLDAQVSLDGVFDPVAEEWLSDMMADRDNLVVMTYYPQGFAAGGPAWGYQGWITSFDVNTPVGDAATFTSQMQSSSGYERGVSLHPLQAEVSGGNTTGQNNGAASAAGGVGFLQATAASSLAVKIQDSADNSSWADILTFNSLSAAGQERKEMTGTVRQYVRALWTGSGTFAASFTRK